MPTSRQSSRRASRTSSSSTEEDSERCGCCSKDDLWSLCDAFGAMDRRRVGSVSRQDFFWSLRALLGVEQQKAIKRSKLSEYFHKTAQDISFDAFVRRALPMATEADFATMLKWASLRFAYNILDSRSFKGAQADVQQAFTLLSDNERQTIGVHALLRARIFTREELEELQPSCFALLELTFDEFCGLALEKYYWQRRDKQELDEEAAESMKSTWRKEMRQKFQSAQSATKGVEHIAAVPEGGVLDKVLPRFAARGTQEFDSERFMPGIWRSETDASDGSLPSNPRLTFADDGLLSIKADSAGFHVLSMKVDSADVSTATPGSTPGTSGTTPMTPVAPISPPTSPPRPKQLQRKLMVLQAQEGVSKIACPN